MIHYPGTTKHSAKMISDTQTHRGLLGPTPYPWLLLATLYMKTPTSHAQKNLCSPKFGDRLISSESGLPRENKRMIDRSIREIERERRSLQNQEKKLILEMKKSAKKGQMRAIKVMAKDLIRKRHQMKRSYELKSQLTMKSTQAIGKAIKGVTKAMGPMNRQMNLPTLQKRMRELERQNERMEMASEVMGDAIDDSLEGGEEEVETEEVTEELVNQVLDEIGIKANDQLAKAPSSAVAAPAAAPKKYICSGCTSLPETAVSEGGIDEALKARLDNLRNI